MCSPELDSEKISGMMQEFCDDVEGNSDMDEDEGPHEPEEAHALALLQDLDAQAHIMQEFKQVHDAVDIADHGQVGEAGDVEADIVDEPMILGSEALAGLPAEEAELISKLASGGLSCVSCVLYFVLFCIV